MIRPLIAKEVKDLLRDPRVILPFIIGALVMPVVGLALMIPMRAGIEQAIAGARAVGLVDLDGSTYSSQLAEWLSSKGLVVVVLEPGPPGQLAEQAASRGLSLVLIVPKGFGESLERKQPANITVLDMVREISFFGAAGSELVLRLVEEYTLTALTRDTPLTPEVVRNPLRRSVHTYLLSKGVQLPGDPASYIALALAALLVPLLIIGLALTPMQMAATSMAVENEERTLETLLTLPVRPRDILLAKLLGMFAVALLGSLLEIAGLLAYFFIIFLQMPLAGELRQPTEAAQLFGAHLGVLQGFIDPSGVAFLGVSILLSLFFFAALGVIVGALSRDVRIASTLTAPLGFLAVIPSYAIVFMSSDIMGPALRTAFYIIPLTQPVIAAKDLVSSTLPPEAPLYLVSSLFFTLGLLWLASKVFAFESLARLQRSFEALAEKLSRRKPPAA
uniref:ABC transporter permease n=1 Tax=Thermofilum pendens TaxID=2269 RepID=A0A7C4FFL6_THEPE